MKLEHIATALAAFISLSAPAFAQDSCPRADNAKVEPTVERFLAALGAVDEPALKTLLAPDFLAFDSGRRYAGTELQGMIAGIKRTGTSVKLSLNEAQVHARCGTAWVTYLNKGELTKDGAVKTIAWLESVVLEWDGAAWRVKFMHATEVAK